MSTTSSTSPRTTVQLSFSAQEHADLLHAAEAAYQSPAAFVNHAVARYIDVRRNDRWEFDTEDWEPIAEFDLPAPPSAPGALIEVDFNSREMRQILAAVEVGGEPLHDFINHALRDRISSTLAQHANSARETERDSPPPITLSIDFSPDDYQALRRAARLDGMQLEEFVQIAVGASIMTQHGQRLSASRIDEDWGPDASHGRAAAAFTTVQVPRDGDELDQFLAAAKAADEDPISFIRRAVRERVVALLTSAVS